MTTRPIVKAKIRHVLSSIRLSLSLKRPRRWFSRFDPAASEQPKAVFQSSRMLVLASSAVHFLPISVSTVLISLNLSGSYLGRTLPGSIIDPAINLALLQIAAKIHELLIVASVTTVVLHFIRKELVHGDGLPLGMLMGAFMFSGLSYFWSPELIGSWGAKYALASKLKVVLVLVLAGLFATLAGPASAVLLIPKEQPWRAGGSVYYLPTSVEQLWPSMINSSTDMTQEVCSGEMLDHGLCLRGGYLSLWNARDLIDIFRRPAYISGSRHNLTTDLILGPRGIDVTNDLEMIRGLRYSGSFRGYACETAVIGTRIVDAMYHKRLLQDWISEVMAIGLNSRGHSPTQSNYKYYRSITATTSSRVPAVRVSCTTAQHISSSSGQFEVPILDAEGCSPSTRATRFMQHDWLADPELHQFHALWKDTSPELGTTSGILVVELPSNVSDDFIAVVGCSIDARWADGSTITSDLRSYATSSNLNLKFNAPVSLGPIFKGPSTNLGQPSYSEFRPVLSNPRSTRIKLARDWLFGAGSTTSNPPNSTSTQQEHGGWTAANFLTFLRNISIFSDLDGSPEAPIEKWNEETPGAVNRTVALEWFLALLVTDALSRTGSERILNTTGPVSSWTIRDYNKVSSFATQLFRSGHALQRPTGPAVTEAKLEITIGGFSYQATSLTDYLALALLALHIVVSLSHVALLFSSGESSSAWASVAEILVLAQNSRPADMALRNTGAGIGCLGTYARMARVYSVTPWDASGGKSGMRNVELVFDEPADSWTAGAGAVDDVDAALVGPQCRGRLPRLQDRDGGTTVVLGEVRRDVLYGHVDRNAVPRSRPRISYDRITV